MSALNLTQTFALADVAEAPAPATMADGDETTDDGDGGEIDETRESSASVTTSSRVRFAGVIGMEGTPTGDGRLIEPGALSWDTPAPLRYVVEDVGAHDGAVTIGLLESIERRDGGAIWAEGFIDASSEAGREAARVIGEGLQDGVSMDLDSVSFEVRVAADVMDQIDGELVESEDGEAVAEVTQPETGEDGSVVVARIQAGDELMVTTGARIRAATLVSIPAFVEARLALSDEHSDDETAPEESEASIVAASAPVRPPLAWFQNPNLEGPTPMRITEDGRVYGHLATWGVCHTASPEGLGTCTEAPSSATQYGYFHTGALITAEGDEIAVGKITMGTGHAAPRAKAMAAAAHYDNTGSAVADVRTGEDAHGVWFAGALRPGVTPEKVRELRASPLSGDWRRLGGNLELVAALAVNVPGFPVPRPAGLVASGQLDVLVAAGMLPPRRVVAPGQPGALSEGDLRYLKRLANRERSSERAALARRVQVARAKAKIGAFNATRQNR